MERFVFNLAVALAVIFAVFAALGVGHLKWEFGDAFGSDPVVRSPAQQVAAQTYAAASVQIEHAAARIIVIPEARTDISVAIDNPGGVPTPHVQLDGDAVRIDGGLRGRVRDCRNEGVELSGYGAVATAQLPEITIHAPMAVTISVDTGSTTQIGAAQSVDAEFSGCGGATIADVAGPLKLSVSGSTHVTAGAAQALNVEVSGSGHAQIGAVSGDAEVQIGGSGDVAVASLTGDLKSDLGGSGNLGVAAGAINRADIDIGGSGTTHLGAPVQTLSVDIAGSGAVDVVHGPLPEADLDVGGSGHVRLAGPVTNLHVSLAGSGGVEVDGAVQDLDAEIAGSGVVRAAEVTGEMHKEIFGPGQVVIGR
ncbi:MAG TPA: DUF2807 domain-containing protein [Caulobacterales bacterium]|nr:DUF2807 domain-containing protein [Caulobacterales bacterium]